MRRILKTVKRTIASTMKSAIIRTPLPLSAQAWAVRWLLPVDPWPKSLVYQQCLANRILAADGATTQTGPFKGMTCITDAEEGCLVPKLLGCYEEELIPAAEEVIKAGVDRLIDVGCASGYWLTGFALRMPRAQAFGFDISEDALSRCRQLNGLNAVQSRVTLLGRCTHAGLGSLIKGRTLVFMDCDGPEYDLLDPELVPALRGADIIVECHDYLNPMITPTLLERFKATHAIQNIPSGRRQPNLGAYPGLKALPPQHWDAALDERRPAVQNWLVMRSRKRDAR
jgi:hypothetical protein